MHIILTFSYTLQYVMHFVIPGAHFNKPQSHFVTVFVSFYDNCVTLWYYFSVLCQTFKKDKCKASTNSGHSHSVKPWPFLLVFEPLTKSLKRVGGLKGRGDIPMYTMTLYHTFSNFSSVCICVCPFPSHLLFFVFSNCFNWENFFQDGNKKVPFDAMHQMKCISLNKVST